MMLKTLLAIALFSFYSLAAAAGTTVAADQDFAVSEIRALLRARSSTVLSSELAGKIIELTVREGDRFNKNQKLVSFNCAEQQAQLHKAKAVLLAAEKTYAVNKRLLKLNSIGQLEFDLAEAEVAKANAEIELVKATLKKCTIYAPFSGRVAERRVDRYQYVKSGEPLLDILDDSRLEIMLLIPSNWLSWLKSGYPFKVFLDEKQQQYPVKVTKIGARIDAVSQSIKIFGVIDGDDNELIPGMSGQAIFEQPTP